MRRPNSLAGRLAIRLVGLVLILPGVALAAEAGAHGEPGIINLNVTILIQAINFLILIFLLSKFLFKPLAAFLANRSAGIEKSLAEAKAAHEEAAKAQAAYRAQMREAQREIAAIREQGQREVEAERQRLLQASRDEAGAPGGASQGGHRGRDQAGQGQPAGRRRRHRPGGGRTAAGADHERGRPEAAGRPVRA